MRHAEYQEDYYAYGRGHDAQAEFDTQARGIRKGLRGIRDIFVYLPLLAIGFGVASQFLKPRDYALMWIGTILAVAVFAYWMVMVLKGYMNRLRERGSAAWILLLLVLIGLTSVMTPWVLHPYISDAFAFCKIDLKYTWIPEVMVGIYIFLRYDFFQG